MVATMMAAFLGLVGSAGYLLVQAPPPHAMVVVNQSMASSASSTGKPDLGRDFARASIATSKVAVATLGPTRASENPPAAARDERFVIKRILPIDGPIRYGEWHWDETGAPPNGPLVMTVDLEARVLSVFRAGYEIGATAVLLGTQEKPTPLGRFPIIWKKADHYSRTYNGAPMPFTHRLTNDGISIHGTKVEKGYASHGCIGVPNGFGKKLFAVTRLGDVVYITRGKRIGKGDSLVGS